MVWAFLIFYQLKEMSKAEAEKAKKRWDTFKKGFPAGIRLIGEYDHAWGTNYNGFFLIEADSSDKFLNWWRRFKDEVRWYTTSTKTILGRKR